MEISVRGATKSSMMKGAQSTSSIPTFRGSLSSTTLGSETGPLKLRFTSSVCSGLDQSNSTFSKMGSSSSRPSSIPRLIPLTNSQKKGYLLRSIIVRNLKDAQREQGPSVNDCQENNKEVQGAPKRPRLAHPASATTTTSSRALARDCAVVEVRKGLDPVHESSEIQRNQESHTALLREQITTFFGTATGTPSKLEPINPACSYYDPIQTTVDSYALEIFTRELGKEAIQYKLTLTKELETQLSKRTDTVKWIRKVGRELKLTPPTFHVATYIVDAYLRVQNVPQYSLELLGAAALFIAAKQEETDCTLSSSTVLKYCAPTSSFTPKRLINMESRILNKLKCEICVPTSLFFMEACASQMTYGDHFVKAFCYQLAKRLLFDSLWEAEMIFTPNSKKARLALHYVVKYVSYNYDLLCLVHEKDVGIWEKFKVKCYPEFRSAVLAGVTLPKRLAYVDRSPMALRDLTNKGGRPSHTRDASSTYTSIRATRSTRLSVYMRTTKQK